MKFATSLSCENRKSGKGDNYMRMKLFGFMLAIIVVVGLGWCLDCRGGEQKEDKEAYKTQMEKKLKDSGENLTN